LTADDIVNVDDLVALDNDPSAATAPVVGAPESLLATAQTETREGTDAVGAALRLVKEVAANRPPDKGGATRDGKTYGRWNGVVEGKEVAVVAIREAQTRVRYVVAARAQAGEGWQTLATGLYAKQAPQRGAGRIHVDLGKTSGLFAEPHKTGRVHLQFANASDTRQSRRVQYRDVRNEGDTTSAAWNHGMDISMEPGTGGQVRTMSVGNFAGTGDTVEAVVIRAQWRHATGAPVDGGQGAISTGGGSGGSGGHGGSSGGGSGVSGGGGTGGGGRADAVMVQLSPGPLARLGEMHECWDGAGQRAAYGDDLAGNDGQSPNQGDTSQCAGMAQEQVPESAAGAQGDRDPEVDSQLRQGGADQFTEADVDLDPTVAEPGLLE
jgi:uncharacterized membrane protein YgcG